MAEPTPTAEPTRRPRPVPGPRLSPDDHSAVEGVTWGVRVAAAWSWRLLVIALGLYVLSRIFLRVELVAFSFVIALFFTAVLHPLEVKLRRIPGPRSVSAALALLFGLAVLAGIGWF
ncbi:MAG: putative heme transporter, partial [Pseudonocardiales bacterium]|nr:putative heme transporter [Pseudonocardiales bacterium]